MPSGRTLEAGKAVIKLSLQDQVSQGLNKIAGKMKIFGGIAAAAGGAVVTVFAAATKQFVEMGDQLSDMSTRTGFAVESLSKLSYAASQSGTSIESVEKAARGMAKVLTSASLGAAASAETLAALGVSLDEIKGLSPDEQFMMLASAVAGVKDPTTRAAMAMKVFGKSGADLLPLLAGGADGMKEMYAEAERLGYVMSAKDAQAAAELDDMLNKLTSQIRGIAVQIGKTVSGPLAEFGEKLSGLLVSANGLVQAHPGLAKGIAGIGGVAVVAGASVAGLGVALQTIYAHPVIAGLALTTAGIVAINDWLEKTYHTAERVGKKLADIGPPQPLTPEQKKGGPYMLDRMGNPILDMPVADFYGDKAEAKEKTKTLGSKDLIGDLPLGTDGPGENTFGNLLLGRTMKLAGLPNPGEKKFNKRMADWLGKAKDAAAFLSPIPTDTTLGDIDVSDPGHIVRKMKNRAKAAIKDFGDDGEEGTGAAIATLDAQNAKQIFGALGMSSKDTPEVNVLKQMLEALERIERKPFGLRAV